MKNSLQVDQNLAFQYRQWRIERIAWVVMGLVLFAGLLGVFGHHPLARTKVYTPDQTLTVEYDRFARYESDAEIKVSVEAPAEEGKLFRLWIDDDYLNTLKVLNIFPVPLRGEAREGSHAFVFQPQHSRFTVKFLVQFQSIGVVTGAINANEGDRVLLKHFVWP